MQSVMPNRRDARGQALVEFALIAPIFFILIFGIIQMAVLFGGQIALTNTAREVARYASTVPAGASLASIQNQALPILQRGIPAYNPSPSPAIGVTYCSYANPTSPVTYSQKVAITITYGHTLFIPLVGRIIDAIDGAGDNRFTVTTREEMKVEAQPAKRPSGTDCGVLNP